MTLRDRLTEDMKQAMKDKEAGKLKLSVIRMVRSAAKNVEIDRRKELDDNELLDVVAKEVKMRRDSLDEFRKAGRPELLAVLEQEIAILMEFLPEQMSEADVQAVVDAKIAELGASDMSVMGQVIGAVKQQVGSAADGALVAKLVKETLQK